MPEQVQNEAMVQRIEGAVAKADLDALEGLYAADMVDHNPFPEQAPGLQQLAKWVNLFASSQHFSLLLLTS